jgi:prepilin-type processing-associated H-X9-DG protein
LNVQWIPGVHAKRGNLALVDGHVERLKPESLDPAIRNLPLATNRLCVP